MIVITISVIFALLVMAGLEVLHKNRKISAETSRKILHVVTGLLAILWPFFISWDMYLIFEVCYLVVVFGLRYSGWRLSQHKVSRLSWGEFFFSFGIIACILLGAPRWLFVVAILHLTFADTAAAVVGNKWGAKNSYGFLGQRKSVAGNLAFIVVSCLIVLGVFIFTPQHLTPDNLLRFLLVPFVAMIAEVAGIFGSDNLLIPATVVLLLR